MLLNCGVGEDPWESLGLQGDPNSPSWRRPHLGVHWKDWCWGWNSNTLATSCEELTHWKRPWCWERLRAGGEGMTENEMVGWHHRLNGHEFGWTLGVGDGQGGLTCCESWGRKESDTTERLKWNWKCGTTLLSTLSKLLCVTRFLYSGYWEYELFPALFELITLFSMLISYNSFLGLG